MDPIKVDFSKKDGGRKKDIVIPPEKAALKIVLSILCTILFAAGAFYFMMPALNFKSYDFYIYIGAVAAIFIALSVSLKIKPNFVVSLIGVICGGIVYYIVYNVVILMGLKTDYLKMLSALIVALFLGVPYLKATYFTKHKDLQPSDLMNPQAGGGDNA